MATPKKIKHNENESINIVKPFKGLTIGLVTQHDTAGTAITTAMLPDPSKITLVIKNMRTKNDVYNGPLSQLHRFLKKGDRDLYKLYNPSAITDTIDLTPGGSGNEKVLQVFNLEMATYHGDYRVTFKTGDNSFKANTKQNSYMTVLPIWSDDAMIHEEIFTDWSLDKKDVDQQLGNGVEEIQILFPPTSGGDFNAITEVNINSLEQNQELDIDQMILYTASHQEDEMPSDYMRHFVVHDGEVLSQCSVSVKVATTTAGAILMVRQLFKNPSAMSSEAESDNRREMALDNVQYG